MKRMVNPNAFLAMSFAFFGAAFPIQSGAFDFKIQNSGVSATQAELQVLHSALDSVKNLIPPAMRSKLPTITFELVEENKRHLGSAGSGKIKLNRSFLNLDGPLPTDRSSRHQDPKTLLLALIIHELAHVYDQLSLPSAESQKLALECSNQVEMSSNAGLCRWISSRSRSVSQDPSFLLATGGWEIQSNASLRRLNYFDIRSPDHYEWESPSETLAVNMEFFLLDPHYQCRRPVLYSYFAERFQHTPFPTASCSNFSAAFLDSSWITEDKDLLKSVDPSRISEIHWLHAGKGGATMSRFGHSMIRLVICAPDRPTVGPDCLKDILHHRVLNFRASIELNTINYADGLRGRYPSILFVSDFMSIHNEYIVDEFRDLESLPLKLNQQEIQKVFKAALETHWGYEGRYYFLSNNCATEALRLLRRALPNRNEIKEIATDRPDTLFEMLIERGFVEIKPKTEPYLYRSRHSYYNQQLALVSQHDPSLGLNSLESYQNLPKEVRARLVESILSNRAVALNRAVYALESRRYLQLFRELHAQTALELQNQIEASPEAQTNTTTTNAAVRALFARFRSAGHLLGSVGYSIPQALEVNQFLSAAEAERMDGKRRRLISAQDERMSKSTTPLANELRWTANTLQSVLKNLNVLTRVENLRPRQE